MSKKNTKNPGDNVTGRILFNYAIRRVLRFRGLDWTQEERKRTYGYLWDDDFKLRQLFESAATPGISKEDILDGTATFPTWDDSIVPDRPCTVERMLAAKEAHKREMTWLDAGDGSKNYDGDSGIASGADGIGDQHRVTPTTDEKLPSAKERESPDLKLALLEKRLTDLENKLVASETARKHLEDDNHISQKKVKQSIESYPYPFWPDLPWGESPDGISELETPLNWSRAHPRPEKQPKESVKAFTTRTQEWETRREEARTRWLRSRLHKDLHNDEEEATWQGAHYLGSGSCGCAGLWVKVNKNKVIKDRMVMKEVAPPWFHWKNPDEWRGKLPREIRIHQLIDSTRTGDSHQNIIRHRGYRLMMRLKRFRIYTDMCSGGQLADALSDRWETDPRLFDVPKTRKQKPLKVLPEAFVWHLLSGLVNACLVLSQGRENEKVEGWNPVVHNDLHAPNVLLEKDSNDPTLTPAAVAKNCCNGLWTRILQPPPRKNHTHLEENDNPIVYRIAHDDGRYPPETQNTRTVPTRITSKSDVCSIGMLMYAIVCHHYSNTGPVLDFGGHRLVNAAPFDSKTELMTGALFPVAHPKDGAYTTALLDLVKRCLEWKPEDRPTLGALRKEIDGAIEAGALPKTNPQLYEPDPFKEWALGRKHRTP
ncbi:uncharacterized protein K460DRAFT_404477 [Cucurbitaria berberidis CBS 394.84]|uniref:non-specific serine/threonine protein kinase n=1 Tax=Cucurbitaria berberidis CBS 394.84 TaxID=1168544 RepID=A0A9P4GP50_9PLEO|nr:uncharacterized protein K460DRAFT_404477 [Cucurbitaria berberidis CBS 394.84]KAF1849242.1 hypothetical protein K460DRAFT_404477 [Cucurbitaria berberidis CBS 394.84]